MLKGGDGKILLDNWQEERQVYDLDETFTKNGHRGLLSTNFDATASDLTEVRENYTPKTLAPSHPGGKRMALLEQALFKKVASEVMEEGDMPGANEFPKESVTHEHYNKEFTPIEHPVTMIHDANKEMPISYWTQKVDKSHGMTQIKTFDTPFRKNAKFSTPIELAYDEPKPYEVDNYPYMTKDGYN
ncbi:sperm-associated antigen 8-like [Symsagittifera roscoffensis]|uniref:sperm-associated antigen 8-like n=1 Tax=Symsagittifera roscoffensis TaxID=84072 RepID=UPI00307BDAEC